MLGVRRWNREGFLLPDGAFGSGFLSGGRRGFATRVRRWKQDGFLLSGDRRGFAIRVRRWYQEGFLLLVFWWVRVRVWAGVFAGGEEGGDLALLANERGAADALATRRGHG